MSPCPHPCLAGSFIQGTCDIVSCEARLFWSVPPQFEVYRIFVFILISHSVPMPISLLLQLQVRVEKVIAGWENESEWAREGGEAAGSWISLKVANNGCNLHLKPRLYTELNTGPLVSWLVRVESAERCQSIDSRMPPWCVGTFHTKVALQVHLSFNQEEMNASAPSRLSATFLIISAVCLSKQVWQDSWHLTVPRYWLHFTAVPTCTVNIFAGHSECIAVALALICGGWEWAPGSRLCGARFNYPVFLSFNIWSYLNL